MTIARGVYRSTDTVVELELAEDVGDVVLDRTFALRQGVGDLLVRAAPPDLAQDLGLVGTERG